MIRKVRVAVIGTGSIAKYRHIPEYADNGHVELVAFVDKVLDRAQGFANQYGGQAFADYKEMLETVKPEAVSICTPNYLHAPIAIACMDAGVHVLVEKPMAATEEEGLAMIEAAKRNNVTLVVGHNQRLMPPHKKAKEILDSGVLGRVISFRTAFGHQGPESWSAEGPNSWFFKKDEAIMGAMGDLGVHKADLIRFLLNDEVVQVSAMVGTLHKNADVDDNANVLLRMKSGAIGTLVASWTYYRNEDNSTILWCENGVMLIGTHPYDQVIVEFRNGHTDRYNVGEISTNEKQLSSHVIDSFIHTLVYGTEPFVSGEEGLKSLKVIFAAFESEATKSIITLD